jgi:hypothetical protein
MPSHQIEGGDYAAGSGNLSGERIHKDAAPATEFRQYQANALWHGLRKLIKDFQVSGDLTAASGSADQTEGYVRLAKAVMRSARRMLSANITNVTVSDFTTILTPTQDVFCYHLIDAVSPQPVNSIIEVFDNDFANQKNRLILIVNKTGEYRLVGTGAFQRYVRLAPMESCWFYAMENGSDTAWMGIGRQFHDLESPGEIDVELRASGSTPSALSPIKFIRHPDDKLITILARSSSQITIVGTPTEVILAPSGDLFPYSVRFNEEIEDEAITFAPSILIYGIKNDNAVTAIARWQEGTIRVNLMGANFADGDTFRFIAFQWTYACNPLF